MAVAGIIYWVVVYKPAVPLPQIHKQFCKISIDQRLTVFVQVSAILGFSAMSHLTGNRNYL